MKRQLIVTMLILVYIALINAILFFSLFIIAALQFVLGSHTFTQLTAAILCLCIGIALVASCAIARVTILIDEHNIVLAMLDILVLTTYEFVRKVLSKVLPK